MKISRSRFLSIRGVRLHLREWGRDGAPRLYMLHGWMDASASFQFMVDALAGDWHVIAPDWRGFGRSAWSGADGYWYPDYFADLDAILRITEGENEAPVRLVGHSMGGNVALMYAGIRPSRVERVAVLDAFGLPDRQAAEAPGRYQQWLEELTEVPRPRIYPSREALAERLRRDNPRLDDARSAWLAGELSQPDGEGWRIAGDPGHRRVNPVLYRRAEAQACWRRVTAPVLAIEPQDAGLRERIGVSDDDHAAALACFASIEVRTVADAGHNLHHDQPRRIAGIVEAFFLSDRA
ncbi:alpha/beta fold hydrolase [Thauera linaloolentis]|uniref:Hydrolase or acytransferase n=1 Tax=Thauera linaloolentis (strain DSM 12138 / JCM 21573 / CCUG 41526 / CIP 105981 / IAM 15112 / NBRC 102519 / 47Lol) TaxID=1123367 RepID=N6YG82_THAL4|nr:alpha/beta hydrolase [Thauera linaloolentis]ENO90515.1 hydrolase or acytransferase [Thauera linaloolentis 47Lol = DSM 12138]MCM8566374.1 alpha/beta hydrolase [Thauera linaloolentis]